MVEAVGEEEASVSADPGQGGSERSKRQWKELLVLELESPDTGRAVVSESGLAQQVPTDQ